MLDQRSLAKTIRGYRFGGLVAACAGFLISSYFPTYFVRITPLLFILICGLIGNVIHESFQPLFDSLAFYFKLFELWVLRALGIIDEETYQTLVNKLVEKRILN